MFVRLSCVSGQAIRASRQLVRYRTGQSDVREQQAAELGSIEAGTADI
jgi:hypothetical protein